MFARSSCPSTCHLVVRHYRYGGSPSQSKRSAIIPVLLYIGYYSYNRGLARREMQHKLYLLLLSGACTWGNVTHTSRYCASLFSGQYRVKCWHRFCGCRGKTPPCGPTRSLRSRLLPTSSSRVAANLQSLLSHPFIPHSPLLATCLERCSKASCHSLLSQPFNPPPLAWRALAWRVVVKLHCNHSVITCLVSQPRRAYHPTVLVFITYPKSDPPNLSTGVYGISHALRYCTIYSTPEEGFFRAPITVTGQGVLSTVV